MADYRICFSVAGQLGGQIKIDANPKPGVTYEDITANINKERLAETMLLGCFGYTADDIKFITPEQYDAEFGDDGDG